MNFDDKDFENQAEELLRLARESIYEALHHLGIECVNEARRNKLYKNQTANLINSIGYAIYDNGNLVDMSFDGNERGTAKNDVDAHAVGSRVAEKAAQNYPNKIVLIVVAGMHYAAYVEAMGKNVLTSAEQYAKQQMPKFISDVQNAVNKAFK